MLAIAGKNLTMRIDAERPRTIINEGVKQFMESEEALYVAGLPRLIRDSAVKKWHLREHTSLHGCVSRLYVNGRPVDFSASPPDADVSVTQFKVKHGCPAHERPDPCATHMCEHGRCVALEGMSYECSCDAGS